jgi:hypothetical protein
MHKLLEEAVNVLRQHVINQAMFVYSEEYVAHADAMYDTANRLLTDAQAEEFLKGTRLLNPNRLLRLANKLSLKTVMDEDKWIDGVAEYIINNKADCADLWSYIKKLSATE